MFDSNLAQRKTSMLLFEIEESFGEFIKDNINDIKDIPNSVIDTLQERKSEIEVTTIEHVVERTYLAEIFHLASVATDNTSLNTLIKEISKLAVIYELYDIRNAIAHPNRAFPICYWYRVAAFACDPLIVALGIDRIHKCLISAEEGIITDPPDEWLENSLFEIRNNLPNHFDHDVTGLIGREKENKKLLSLLTNPRVNTVAVVAPGGYGKTALVLDMLKQQVSNPKTASYADAIIFISLKIETLTATGIQNKAAPQTIEQLKDELTTAAEVTYEVPFENFNECKEYLEDQKLLICIDNLETLLRDNPEAFDELNLELPAQWRILVTSRTVISSNQSITLEPLGKKHSINLISSYIRKKGGKVLGKEFSEKIAIDCYYNPLAIRLSVDKIINGNAIQTAITTTKNEIAEFSFRNLIDSLSRNANKVLEALLLAGESEKIYLCALLEVNLDELSNALRELIPTSLLTRKVYDDVELFDLSTSIRDLLLLEPRNIEIREEIYIKKESLARQAIEVDKKQKELSISTLNVTYIPKETNESLKILLERFHRCSLSNFEKMSNILKDFKNAYETFKNLDIFQREYARTLSIMKDNKLAIKHARIAYTINSKDPINLYILADCCFRNKEYEDSSKYYIDLLKICNELKINDKKFMVSVYHGTFQSFLWKGNYEAILELTDDWENKESFSAVFGGYRATAYKRSVENSFRNNITKYIDGMTKSIDVMNRVFEIAGYLKSPCIQSLKIIDQIEYTLPKIFDNKKWYKFCISSLTFLKDHYQGVIDQQILEKNSSTKIKQIKHTIELLKVLKIKDNPLSGIESKSEITNDMTLVDSSYVEVWVYHVMPDSNRRFAQDSNGVQYFLTKENTSSELYPIWESISQGDKLYVIPSDKREASKATPVTDIIQG
ncbi:NB-ARC domain-containing protein [Thalassomonas haliotis]|uniref:ATP-binding protein n=1 Tax=Thalassomonas haliotis TaxID=485448 RepID=A0ABY7VKK6_9GAMM|nr:ATP-binding protein [Thalassomonas haliotis]WDE13571.1 ATP-binding protein [Thalassomonas haliotis]